MAAVTKSSLHILQATLLCHETVIHTVLSPNRFFSWVFASLLLFSLFSGGLIFSQEAEAEGELDVFIWYPRTTCNALKTPGETFQIELNITSGSEITKESISVYVEHYYDSISYKTDLVVHSVQQTTDPNIWSIDVSAPSEVIYDVMYDLTVDLSGIGTFTEPRCISFIERYPTDLKIIHLTDVHIDFARTEIGKTFPSAKDMVRQVIMEVNLIDPDLVLVTGDLVFRGYGSGVGPSMRSQLQDYVFEMSALDVPLVTCIGNHEVMWNADVVETSNIYQEEIGPLYYYFDIGRVHFLMLNSTSAYMGDSRLEGGFSTEQITWARQTLDAIPDGETTIVAYHHDREKLIRSGSEEMLQLFYDNSDKVQYVFNGHCHEETKLEENGVAFISTLSCGEYDPEDGNGYRLIRIENDQVADYGYGETDNGCIPYNNVQIEYLTADVYSSSLEIKITNDLEESFNSCRLVLEVYNPDSDNFLPKNCTIEQVIPGTEYDLVYVEFFLEMTSEKFVSIQSTAQIDGDDDVEPDDDSEPDDDTADDDTALDDDDPDDDVVDDDVTDDDDDADSEKDTESSSSIGDMIGAIILVIILAALGLAYAIYKIKRLR